MSEFLIPSGIITILIVLNGLFVAAEFAIVAAPTTRIAQIAEEGSRAARHVLSILRDPDRQNRYITTAQIGITIVSLGLGMYGEHVVADWLLVPLERFGHLAEPLAHTLATILAVMLLTYLHVVIGEMVPKTLALQSSVETVLRLDGVMVLVERLFTPAVWVLNLLGNGVVRLLGIPPLDTASRLMSPEELEFIVEESVEGGLLESEEQLLLENIFDLRERTVGQVMTPRTRVVGIPSDSNLDDVLQIVCEMQKSRYPIFDGDLDQIVGLLHIKDLARHLVHQNETWDLRALSRPAVFIPESLTLEKMLLRMRDEQLQMAVVFDEYGGIGGLITSEDLVEEVLGEIQDEFDHETPLIKEVSAGELKVRGDLILDELNQLYALALEHPDADTVGGLVMALLGRIPAAGDHTELAGVRFVVEAIDGLAVQLVTVHLPTEPES